MNQVSLRENCIIGAVFTLLCTAFLVALSIEVGFDGWKQLVDLSVGLILLNISSCLYVVIVNRPTLLFYLREIVICTLTAGIAFYIWITITLWTNLFAFFICLFVVLTFYAVILYLTLKTRNGTKNTESSKSSRLIGIAGALGAASQIVSSDNGVLLLIATLASFIFSSMAAFYLRLAIKRRWGKASGAWNEI